MTPTDGLTIQQAYAAMYRYLERVYELTKADELGGMLGSMSFLSDGSTADPAVWSEWLEAVADARNGRVDVRLHLLPKPPPTLN